MSWNSGYHNQSGTDGFERIDSWGERKVFASYSDNDGNSWSSPVDLTSTLLPSNYTWDAIGPGIGIQKTQVEAVGRRSEEHTSELQSRENLVCRLLLEKKNKR